MQTETLSPPSGHRSPIWGYRYSLIYLFTPLVIYSSAQLPSELRVKSEEAAPPPPPPNLPNTHTHTHKHSLLPP